MTKLLDKALEAVRRLPPSSQDEIAHAMLALAGREAEAIDPAHLPAILEGLAQAKRGQLVTDDEVEATLRQFEERDAIAISKAAAARGEFATDEQVRAVWAKHGL
jgi:predicted transcriptional regulator